MNEVFTYYEPLASCGNRYDEIRAWQHNWEQRGWRTYVLNQAYAEKHPMWKSLLEKNESFPSINPTGYDLACWARWLALDSVGGGIMVDYDVGNRNLYADEVILGAPLILEVCRVPCAVAADERGAKTIVDKILSHTPAPRNGHYSDMYFFQDSQWPQVDVCKQMGHEGWEKAKLVHFATASIHKYGGSKAQYISTL